MLCFRVSRVFSRSSAAIVAGAALACASVASAQVDRAPERSSIPPLAQGVTVDVIRGQAVTIPLAASGKHGETVQFLVRTPPQHGTLEEPRRVDRTSGSVRYQHGGMPDHTTDVFSFAAQSSGTPVSAPAKVTINIIDPPAELQAARKLEFGPTPVGQTQRKTLTITNVGGSTLESKLEVLAPWKLDEGFPAEYTLVGGESLQVPLVFAPHAPGESTSILKLGKGRSELTLLRGTATAAFTLSPSHLSLRESPGQLEAPFTLTNNASQPVTIQLTWPEGFTGPDAVELPPQEARQVMATLATESALALEGTLKATLAGLTLNAALRAPALPARLDAPTQLDLGFTPDPAQTSKRLTLRNAGGLPLVMDVRKDGDFVTPGLKEVVGIDPGAAMEIDVYPPQKSKGEWVGRLHFTVPGGHVHSIRISGIIPAEGQAVASASRPETPKVVQGTRASASTAAAASKPMPSAAADPTSLEAVISPPEPSSATTRTNLSDKEIEEFGPHILTFLADRQIQAQIPEVRVDQVTRSSISLSWPKSSVPPQELKIQQTVLSLDAQKKLKTEWIPASHGPVARGPERDEVELTGLEPGITFTLRVVRVTGLEMEPLSRPFNARTEAKPQSFVSRGLIWKLPLAFLIVTAIGAFAWFRYLQPRFANA